MKKKKEPVTPEIMAELTLGRKPKNKEEKRLLKQIKEIEAKGRSVYIPGEI